MTDERSDIDLDAWDVAPLSEGFEDRLLEAWDDEQETSSRHRPLARWVVLATVAAAALLVLAWPRRSPTLVDSVDVLAGTSARVVYEPGNGWAEQSSGTATYRVTSGTPFEVRTPAATITVHGTEFTVEMLTMKDERRRTYLGAGALAMAGAAVAVYVTSGEVGVENAHGGVVLRPGSKAVASEHVAPRTRPEPKRTAGARSHKSWTKSMMSVDERRAVQRHLEEALETRQRSNGGTAAKSSAADEGPSGHLDEGYIQQVVSEDLVPLVEECYQSALEEEPALRGSVLMKFSIVGDASVGGLVEDVEFVSASDADSKSSEDRRSELLLSDHPEFAECFSASVESMLFDPPSEGGGRLDVTQRFELRPDEPPGDAPAAD